MRLDEFYAFRATKAGVVVLSDGPIEELIDGIREVNVYQTLGFWHGTDDTTSLRLLRSLLPCPRMLPLRLALQQFLFRDAEHPAYGAAKSLGLCVAEYVRRWRWFHIAGCPTSRF